MPVTSAIMMAIQKLKVFLRIVDFDPKYCFSIGNVNKPTIIKEVVKADITMNVMPF